MIISSFYKSNCDCFPTFIDWDKTSCSGRVEVAEFSSRFVELKLGNSEAKGTVWKVFSQWIIGLYVSFDIFRLMGSGKQDFSSTSGILSLEKLEY